METDAAVDDGCRACVRQSFHVRHQITFRISGVQRERIVRTLNPQAAAAADDGGGDADTPDGPPPPLQQTCGLCIIRFDCESGPHLAITPSKRTSTQHTRNVVI